MKAATVTIESKLTASQRRAIHRYADKLNDTVPDDLYITIDRLPKLQIVAPSIHAAVRHIMIAIGRTFDYHVEN